MRHIAIHQNQGIAAELFLEVGVLYDSLYCLKPIKGNVTNLICVYFELVLQYDFKSINIEYLVINYKDLLSLPFLPHEHAR